MADLIGDALAPYALIMRRGRAIADIIPDVVVEEAHSDQLVITEHPVESGAAISDHAFKRPAEVEMRIGFSDSTGGGGYSQDMYQALLALQAEREPFSVSTGKRLYSNMLIQSLTVTTDSKTENALNASVGLKQVIITSTQGGGSAAPNSDQANPEATGAVQQGGSKTPTPVLSGKVPDVLAPVAA